MTIENSSQTQDRTQNQRLLEYTSATTYP